MLFRSNHDQSIDQNKKQPPSVSAFQNPKFSIQENEEKGEENLEEILHQEVGGEILQEVEGEMKVEEFLQESQEVLTLDKVLEKANVKPMSSTRLYHLWRDLNVVVKTGVFIVEASPKVAGQFSHLGKKFGPVLIPIMVDVVHNWIDFGKFLKEQGIVYDFPDKPHPGFFLKHGEMAVQFHEKQKAPKTSGPKPYVIGSV